MIERARKLWEWFQDTLPWRAWTRFSDLRGNRLAGAVAFYAFVSLFPLLFIGAAVMSATFGAEGVDTMQDILDENLPGIEIDVEAFYQNSGAIGLVGAVTLLFTGLRWVDAVRAAVRSMWRLDDQPGNVVVRKLWDVAALIGLGVLIGVSWVTSAFLSRFASQLLDWLGIDGTLGRWTLRIVAFVLAVGVSTLLFAYLLTGLPRIRAPLRELVVVSLLGGAAFEVLKQFLIVFADTASQNTYAAFATPLALIAWIYLNTRLLMMLAALMAQAAEDQNIDEAGEPRASLPTAVAGVAPGAAMPHLGDQGARIPSAGSVGVAQPSPVVTSVRQARMVGFAAGGVLGLMAFGAAAAIRRAGGAVVSAVRDRRDDD